jgi:hypothetical protein
MCDAEPVATLESIVRDSVAGEGPSLNTLVEYAHAQAVALPEAFDKVAVEIGQRFLTGALTFGDADQAINALWVLMTRTSIIPDLAFLIFDAFDQGEYDHHDGLDPVQAYTVPGLNSALGD